MTKAVMHQNSSLRWYVFKILILFYIQPLHYTDARWFSPWFLSTQDLFFFWTLIGETGALSEVRRSISTVTWNPWLYTLIYFDIVYVCVWLYIFINLFPWSGLCSVLVDAFSLLTSQSSFEFSHFTISFAHFLMASAPLSQTCMFLNFQDLMKQTFHNSSPSFFLITVIFSYSEVVHCLCY